MIIAAAMKTTVSASSEIGAGMVSVECVAVELVEVGFTPPAVKLPSDLSAAS